MRTFLSRADQLCFAIAGAALVAVLTATSTMAQETGRQQTATGSGPAREPRGLPPPNWPHSPHHAVIDGWGRVIPCRCRFNGKLYQVGEIVCMSTHVGTVLTRCDIFENNTSWMPSREPCVPPAGS